MDARDDDYESKITTNIQLCYDIFERILPFLPVKSLLRFRSVCKQLCYLISGPSPALVNSHLNSFRPPESHIIFTHHPGLYEVSIPVPQLTTMPPSANSDFSAVEINEHPFDAPIESVFSSCNGLLLVAIGQHMFLWNPSTREHIELFGPEYTQRWNIQYYEPDTDDLVGIGYNSDEYKVIVYSQSYYYGRELIIYSSKFGYRHKVPNDFTFNLLGGGRGVTVNGSPHWLLNGYKDDEIVQDLTALMYFDIVNEKFKSLPIPAEWRGYTKTNSPRPEVSILRGCLCATHVRSTYSHVWVMNEYGVEGSWTQLFVIPASIVKPLGFMNNGQNEVVFADERGCIVKYNLDTSKCETVMSLTFDYPGPVEFRESLVSPRLFAMTGRKKRIVELR